MRINCDTKRTRTVIRLASDSTKQIGEMLDASKRYMQTGKKDRYHLNAPNASYASESTPHFAHLSYSPTNSPLCSKSFKQWLRKRYRSRP